MKANLVKKKVVVQHRDIIKYQLLTHCFVENIRISTNELDCLSLLGLYDECGLSEFCNIAVEENIFKNPQTVRNFLTKAQKTKLIIKTGTNKKKIFLNKDLKIQTKGNIILNYTFIYVAENK